MDGSSLITVQKIYTGTSIGASGVGYTDIIDLETVRGDLSLQVKMVGTGTATIAPLVSHDPVGTADANCTWVQPYNSAGSAISICTALAANGGPGADGLAVYPVSIPVASRLKFRITEAGGAAAITPLMRVAIQ